MVIIKTHFWEKIRRKFSSTLIRNELISFYSHHIKNTVKEKFYGARSVFSQFIWLEKHYLRLEKKYL